MYDSEMCHDVLTAFRPLWDGMKRNKSKWRCSPPALYPMIHGEKNQRLLDCRRGRGEKKEEEITLVKMQSEEAILHASFRETSSSH